MTDKLEHGTPAERAALLVYELERRGAIFMVDADGYLLADITRATHFALLRRRVSSLSRSVLFDS
jgi:hypothetical protein